MEHSRVGAGTALSAVEAERVLLPFRPAEEWDLSRRLRCLVDSTYLRVLPQIDAVEYISSSEDDYDVIIATEALDERAFSYFLARCSNPAAPLLTFSDSFGQRADAVVRERSAAAFISALSSVSSLVGRMRMLSAIPVGIERTGLLALALAHTRNVRIEAVWDPSRPAMVSYPILLGTENPRATLEELSDAGLLRRSFFERLHECEHCFSSRLGAREVCHKCSSSHLSESSLVHHYPCGYQAPQPLFECEAGFICPKCAKPLRHYGVDYDKPGTLLTCMSCSEVMTDADVSFACADCAATTSGERARKKDWSHFDILPDGVAALKSGSLPYTDHVAPSRERQSLRDFELLLASHLKVAKRHCRPLTAWRINLDLTDARRQVGERQLPDVIQLMRDVVLQNLQETDAAATMEASIVACLPETDRKAAERGLAHIHTALSKAVGPRLVTSIQICEVDQIAEFIRGLR